MIYKRGRYYWAKFQWEGKTIRKSLRAEDLETAQECYKILRNKLAKRRARSIEPERASLSLDLLFSRIRPCRDGQPQIFCDGSVGSKSAGFMWWNNQSDDAYVERRDGVTSNQAEYLAIISALENLPLGSRVQIISDSQLCVQQLRGSFSVNSEKLEGLRSQVKGVIRENELDADFRWVQRSVNVADKLACVLNGLRNSEVWHGKLANVTSSCAGHVG